ncbi:uncharacterized protein A1O9_09833 [Exophiala aquamarina CBS 119918]|uniref:DUF1330 domain-containing protein n=1 Tax=Exophiala aquamarina CBS 119918 TaxID=1182545 RepID=A0A072P437_9EURO|nr:uncharacterized protein A1O9_09833 [Exophiala aquamarina CBS 119918]KEF54038.1 hypothetical protein A1O9_09833 [Exophiala aquamarina CBS 119918]
MAADGQCVLGDLEAASKRIPVNKPYIMMNMMNFRPLAQYAPDFEGFKSTSLSGLEAYTIYRDEFIKRAHELGVKSPEVIFLGRANTNLISGLHEGESWDLIVMVRFNSFASFRSVLEDPVYKKSIAPHRVAGTRDFRSFAVTEN